MSKKTSSENTGEGQMPLSGHLRELRNRIVVCLLVLTAAVLAGLRFAPDIVELLLSIGRTRGYSYIFIAPQELMMQYVSVSLLAGVIVTVPVIGYEAWSFARPGLKRGESTLFLLAMIFGLLFFCVGVYFAYRIMLPFMLEFFIGLSDSTDITASVTVENYISFLLTVFVVFGAVFELPVLSVLLCWVGVLRAAWMRKARRVMVVLVFILAAVITPPDVVSQVMVALPMVVLYELSIVLCAMMERFCKRKKQERE